MLDQLFAIGALVTVALFRSLTRTGKNLDVSTSSILRAVMMHERDIQMRLLHRITRSVTLSEGARAYFESCVKALDLLDEAARCVSCEERGDGGELRVAVHPVVMCDLLPRLLGQYRERAPEVSVVVQIVDRSVNMVDDRFDLAILPSSLVDQGNVYRQMLRAMRRALVATSAYRKARSRIEHASDRCGHVLLLESHLREREEPMIEVVDGTERVEIAGIHCWTRRASISMPDISDIQISEMRRAVSIALGRKECRDISMESGRSVQVPAPRLLVMRIDPRFRVPFPDSTLFGVPPLYERDQRPTLPSFSSSTDRDRLSP
ncbi:hypothetical protein GNZ12_43110 [Paraburkholderia sp. 1N]|uniref:HTH lysR-type domain-containing protein n=1 Tax=Paraburkholderia solitsugae TaxID=2675748 RepID=A0ABX2C7H6_9BURK|nr:hypothetical protein [Paraburkholderia solitsugae]